jgi:hypothetical protein
MAIEAKDTISARDNAITTGMEPPSLEKNFVNTVALTP